MKLLISFLFMSAFLFSGIVYAGEASLFEASKEHCRHGDYYNAVTESMRYRYLYPNGAFYSESMLLMSKALYKGGDVSRAVSTIDKCGEMFEGSPAGDEASYLAGRMRVQSYPTIALQNYDKYLYLYKDSFFTEMVFRDNCFASVFIYDFNGSRRRIDEYRKKYPQGEYLSYVNELAVELDAEENRKFKSMKLAIAGSILIPGFGYFYTGDYMLGSVSFLTNVCLIAIIADGIIRGNIFQWAFFGLIELAFYQYSIYGAMKSVQEYNSHHNFVGKMKLSFEKNFDLF